MTAHDILAFWKESVPEGWDSTCDALCYESAEKPIQRIAVCFKLTLAILEEMRNWNADMIITHEPLWPAYDREMKAEETDPTVREMDRILREEEIAILRLHDHAHLFPDDFIHMAFLKKLGLDISEKSPFLRLGFRQYKLTVPHTARQIAELVQKNCGVAHPRIAGAVDVPLTTLCLALGGVGNLGYDVLRDTSTELFISGEIGELGTAFYTHSAAAIGMTKACMALGHCESERYGMNVLADWMAQRLPGLKIRYFHTEDTYEIL